MKVEMEVREESKSISMFSSVPVFRVYVQIDFSEEEKEALAQARVMDQFILEVEQHPKLAEKWGPVRQIAIKEVVKNNGCQLDYFTAMDAQNALEYVEQQLRILKQNITAVSAPKVRSLEL